jgi:hypothetical protein
VFPHELLAHCFVGRLFAESALGADLAKAKVLKPMASLMKQSVSWQFCGTLVSFV